ncbi:ABC transporter ATP-binding protein [Nocardia sp. NPDC019395]|uniref:ABC transporter ATP-binding protein n=1 Tax=Nocardia sp. NPDC019395 TaxID=3154686 RepID=UPI00340110C4
MRDMVMTTTTADRDGAGTHGVDIANLNHTFISADGIPVPAVDNFSLTVRAGEFISIIGPSGCGKTTVLNIVAGLEEIQSGRVSVLGRPAKAGRPEVSTSFARDALLPWRSARENVALPLELRGVPKAERLQRADELLAKVGLSHAAGNYRGQLSQGMRQRVALARALVVEPELLLLDEPFAALDSQTRVLVQGELLRLLQTGANAVTTLMVTHDLAEAIALSDTIVLMGRRPGTVKETFQVDLPRPRDAVALRSNHQFTELHERIWESLAQEVEL